MHNEVTPAQLIKQFRSEVDDKILDPADEDGLLWTGDDVLNYINRAQQALAVHIDYLREELQRQVTAGQSEIPLPLNIIDVFSVYSVGQGRNLTFANRPRLNRRLRDDYGLQVQGNWRDDTGDPRTVFLDVETGKLFLVPEPVSADTLILQVSKLPDEVTNDSTRLSFRRPDFAWALLPYMKKLAYSKHDSDAYNPNLSLKYDAEAQIEFAKVYDSIQKLRQSNEAGTGTTGYGGIPFPSRGRW